VYSVFPHSGSWQEAGTVQEAYLLNNSLRAYVSHSGSNALPQRYSLVEHSHRNIMIECVKKAEDGPDTIIRLYEFENRRTDVHLHLHQKAAQIWLCNLLEEQEVLLAENSQDFVVPAEPFGIVTVRVEPSV
jgi:alpha-mannosidase